MQCETDNAIDGEIHKFCKECPGKKCNAGTTIDIEVSDLLDTNNNNSEIFNERHDMLHNNYDEWNATIDNERHDMLHENFNE